MLGTTADFLRMLFTGLASEAGRVAARAAAAALALAAFFSFSASLARFCSSMSACSRALTLYLLEPPPVLFTEPDMSFRRSAWLTAVFLELPDIAKANRNLGHLNTVLGAFGDQTVRDKIAEDVVFLRFFFLLTNTLIDEVIINTKCFYQMAKTTQ